MRSPPSGYVQHRTAGQRLARQLMRKDVRPPLLDYRLKVTDSFLSLADAVRASFPTAYCRVIAIREHGSAGIALFDVGPVGQPYLYEVHYERRGGEWSEGNSGNMPGWSHVGDDATLGTVTDWGDTDVPDGADRVRLEFENKVCEEPVIEGVYFGVWWDVPCPTDLGPRVTGFRVNGKWVNAPAW